LSAWQPRRPAPGLKARIFTSHRRPAPEERSFWNLLVPALACVILSLGVLNPNTLLSPASLKHHLMGNLVLSNLSYSAYASSAEQTPQNHLDSLTFDWTNRSLLASPIGFTSSTN
jgi:hypothetical protein